MNVVPGRMDGHATFFGDQGGVAVTRALAEFHARRPVLVASRSERALTLAVEGLDTPRLDAFLQYCVPVPAQLVVTVPRARALGIDTCRPVAFELARAPDVATIFELVLHAKIACIPPWSTAGSAAAAALDLAKLAQGLPAVLAAHMQPDQACTDAIAVEADAIGAFREDILRSLTISGESRIPLSSGIVSRFIVFRDALGDSAAAVIVGDPDFSAPIPVRLHSACLTGDVFGSRRCDCGDQLKLALAQFETNGGGIILYLPQEGRGVGLANKMRAYALQDEGLDTVDANTTLGFNDDERDYRVAGRMLQMLHCTRILLLTNNPAKLDGLAQAGIEIVGRLPIETALNADNRRYLTAKAVRGGHRLDQVIASLCHAPDLQDNVAEIASWDGAQ
jgi:GTP cyclohydrolase II